MQGQPLSELPLTFFDLETTGLAPARGHRVCELALRRVRGVEVEAEYATLVNPQRLPDPRALAVNGISPDLLHDAPLFAEVADTFLELIQGSVLVAHNAPFDMAFLSAELGLLDQPPPLNPVLDTLVLARRLLRRSSYSLQSLASDLALESFPSHRAMQDVLALQGVFAYLHSRLTDQDIYTLEDTQRFARGLAPDMPDPSAPPLIARAIREQRRLLIVYRSRSSPDPTRRLIQPLELTQERKGIYLRAYCYLRDDLRVFALEKIEWMELEQDDLEQHHRGPGT
jgi:DNA polymerase-3 subunit epsilon